MKSNDKLKRLKRLLKELEASGSVTAEEGRRRLTQAEAELKELRLAERRGKLVDAGEVEAAAFNRGRDERDALLNLPARIAPTIAAEFSIDDRKLFLALERHVRQFLEERSKVGALLAGKASTPGRRRQAKGK